MKFLIGNERATLTLGLIGNIIVFLPLLQKRTAQLLSSHRVVHYIWLQVKTSSWNHSNSSVVMSLIWNRVKLALI